MKRNTIFTAIFLLGAAMAVADHGNSRREATPVSPTSTTDGVLERNDTDYFRIELAAAGTLVLGTSGEVDTHGRLEDRNGSRIATDNNSGEGKNFRIGETLEPGTYYLGVRGRKGSTGAYTLTATFTAFEVDDHGNSRAEATRVSTASSTTGNLERGEDVDYFRIEVGAAGLLTVVSGGDAVTTGRLEQGDGAELATGDRYGDDGDNFRIAYPVAAGTYYVAVSFFSVNATSWAGEYTLEVSFTPDWEPPDQEGDLRLVGGNEQAGGLEIWYAGEWGTVCGDRFDTVDAHVACRQLGYASGRAVHVGGPYDDRPIWLGELACAGDETRLDECPHAGFGVHNCVHFEDVGVSCSSREVAFVSIAANEAQVSEGQAASFTLTRVGSTAALSTPLTVAVDVSESGDMLASPVPAGVVFGAGAATSTLLVATEDDAAIEPDSRITVAIVEDPGFEVGDQASASVLAANDDHPPVSDEGNLRLVGDHGHDGRGRLEIWHAGEWGTVCDDRFDTVDAHVACRQLGYASGTAQRVGGPYDGRPIWLDEVACAGDETRLDECPHAGFGVHNCVHFEDVGVSCSSRELAIVSIAADGIFDGGGVHFVFEPRVSEGQAAGFTLTRVGSAAALSTPLTVAVEVSESGDMLASPVPASVEFGAGDASVTLLVATEDDVVIEPDSRITVAIVEDPGFEVGDQPSASVLVVNDDDPSVGDEGDLRLAGAHGYDYGSAWEGDGGDGRGRLEIWHAGEWGTVCDDRFDTVDADVACRQLGYASGTAGRVGGPYDGSPIWLDEVACAGDETRLDECPHAGFGVHDCVHFEDVGVSCTGELEPTPTPTLDAPANTVTDRTSRSHLRINWDAPAGATGLVYDVCIQAGTADCAPAAREYAQPFQQRGDETWTFHLFGNPRGGTDGLTAGTTYRMCVLARRGDEFSPTVCVTSATRGG